MSQIKSFKFNEQGFKSIKQDKYGHDWPVVYIIENNNQAYVGETVNAFSRSKQHYDNPDRRQLKNIHIITDNTYNKSATLDIESSLIQYMSADSARILQNANGGLKNHSYFDRERYQAKIKDIWSRLQKKQLAKKDILEIENSDLFKYSPYKSLTEDQAQFVENIFKDIQNNQTETYIVNGQPGTGKTVLATYLMKFLVEHKETKHLKLALVIPMGSLRKTIKKVFRNIKGLTANMVVTASDVAKSDYDLVIVDEAHRLKRRKNLGAAFGSFDKTNKKLGLNKEATHVDWIMKKSKQQIFFYDKDQSVMPADVGHTAFQNLKVKEYNLTTQLRVNAGEKYIKFIEDILNLRNNNSDYGKHDFKIYDDPCEMVDDIKQRDKELGLCRLVAGYAWPWLTNPDRNEHPANYDIDLGNGCKLKWNSTAVDWVNSPSSLDEVGCIHTTQGYDLNYVGVIIGPELKYDLVKKEMIVDRDNYYDRNGRAGVDDPEELKRYIINIYKTLLVRGIKGTYVYIVDKNLREYFKSIIKNKIYKNEETKIISPISRNIKSPLTIPEMIMIPMLGNAPCGDPELAIQETQEEIPVNEVKIHPGYKYFIIKADGDSMNLAGIKDRDLVLCKFGQKGETGDRVVALLDGENVTIKMYDKKNGHRILLPKSSNPKHKLIVPNEGDTVIGVVQEVLPSTKDYE